MTDYKSYTVSKNKSSYLVMARKLRIGVKRYDRAKKEKY